MIVDSCHRKVMFFRGALDPDPDPAGYPVVFLHPDLARSSILGSGLDSDSVGSYLGYGII